MIPKATNNNDSTAFKIAVANGYDNDYAMYIGPSEWSDEMVLEAGQKLPSNLGQLLALELPFLEEQRFNRTYRR